jgi:hypothetical protein
VHLGKLILPKKHAIVVGVCVGAHCSWQRCPVASSVSFHEKMPKCLAFFLFGRRLRRGIVPIQFSKVGMSFGPSTRGYDILGFGATTHIACTMICGLEDMVHDVEHGCNAGLN